RGGGFAGPRLAGEAEVGVGADDNTVDAGRAGDGLVARAEDNDVVAAAGRDDVVAGAGLDHHRLRDRRVDHDGVVVVLTDDDELVRAEGTLRGVVHRHLHRPVARLGDLDRVVAGCAADGDGRLARFRIGLLRDGGDGDGVERGAARAVVLVLRRHADLERTGAGVNVVDGHAARAAHRLIGRTVAVPVDGEGEARRLVDGRDVG